MRYLGKATVAHFSLLLEVGELTRNLLDVGSHLLWRLVVVGVVVNYDVDACLLLLMLVLQLLLLEIVAVLRRRLFPRALRNTLSLLLGKLLMICLGELRGKRLLHGRRRFSLIPFALPLVHLRLDVEDDIRCPFCLDRVEVLDAVRLLFVGAATVEHQRNVLADVEEGVIGEEGAPLHSWSIVADGRPDRADVTDSEAAVVLVARVAY